MPTLYLSRFISRVLAASLWLTMAVLAGGCASRPESPILLQPGGSVASATVTETRLRALLPADVLLLGEQHDAGEHQQIGQQVIAQLSARGLLAALVLEMAEAGVSTGALHPSSSEEQTRNALRWREEGWPWSAYGPAVMTAVRAGIPVLGANLSRTKIHGSMADSRLDVQLPGPALKAQQQLIRIGHCNLLPESQITPMTRVQIARDISMATTIAHAALPGKVVLLLAGNGHVDRKLGVPQHLPAALRVKAVHLSAGGAADNPEPTAFDSVWPTGALPARDYCARLRQQLEPRPDPSPPAKP